MSFEQSVVQKTRNYRRKFEIGENVAVAASTKETVFSFSFSGIAKELKLLYNGDDVTGSPASQLDITCDGVVILSHTLSELYDMCVNTAGAVGNMGLIRWISYNADAKYYAFMIQIDSKVFENIIVEITNADATNSASLQSGFIYDEEI